MKPIETEYHGYRFRSRLEARWAVFFDALGIEWRYEPEGFEPEEHDESPGKYLPDFRVKCWGVRGVCMDPNDTDGLCPSCVHSTGDDVYSYHYCAHTHEVTINNDANGICVKCGAFERVKPFDLYVEVKGHMTQYDADRIDAFYGNGEHPILIVGDIPRDNGEKHYSYAVNSNVTKSYEPMDGIGIYPFNYETIDGDHFAAYPAAHDGRFYLMGDDSNYTNFNDLPAIEAAYDAARKARFEFGETPR